MKTTNNEHFFSEREKDEGRSTSQEAEGSDDQKEESGESQSDHHSDSVTSKSEEEDYEPSEEVPCLLLVQSGAARIRAGFTPCDSERQLLKEIKQWMDCSSLDQRVSTGSQLNVLG